MAADYQQMTIKDLKNGPHISGTAGVIDGKLVVSSAEGFHVLISDKGLMSLGQILRNGECSFFPGDPKFGVNTCLFVNSVGEPSLSNSEDGMHYSLVDIAILRDKPEIAQILVEVYHAKPTVLYNETMEKAADLANQEYIRTQRTQLINVFTATSKNESKPISAYTFFGKISDAMGEQEAFEKALNRTTSLESARKLVDMALEGNFLSREFRSKVEAVGQKIEALEQLQNEKGTVFNEESKSKSKSKDKGVDEEITDLESLRQQGKSAYLQRMGASV